MLCPFRLSSPVARSSLRLGCQMHPVDFVFSRFNLVHHDTEASSWLVASDLSPLFELPNSQLYIACLVSLSGTSRYYTKIKCSFSHIMYAVPR